MKLHLPIGLLSLLLLAPALHAEDKIIEDKIGVNKFQTIYGNQTWSGTADEFVRISKNTMSNSSTNGTSWAGGVLHLYSNASLTITGYGNVSFDLNTASGYQSWGAALYTESTYKDTDRTEFKVNGNGKVSFTNNESTPTKEKAYGGAIYGKASAYFQMSGNELVTFSGNKAVSPDTAARAYGGAIYMESGSVGLEISHNTSEETESGVIFENNMAQAAYMVQGGAICYASTKGAVTLTDNSTLKFEGNSVIATKTSSVYGGAIDSSADIIISGNGEVTFDSNFAKTLQTETRDPYATAVRGGAINVGGLLTITGNTKVEFTDNYILANLSAPHPTSGNIYSMGGAVNSKGGLILQGNDEVTFNGNYEYKADGYTMNSLYVDGNAKISSNPNGTVAFHDGLIVKGNVDLNSSYENIAQTGEILFSGAYVLTNLQTIKDAAGAGDVTTEEIARSRRFSVNGSVTLHAGTLTLDEAVLDAGAFVLKSGATFKLDTIDPKKASLTLDNNCVFESNSNVILLITEHNIGALSNACSEVSILVSDVEATTAEANISAVGELGIQWEYEASDFEWKVENRQTWITGTVNAVTDIEVDDESELAESITDVADGTKRSVTVEDAAVTLSGDNTHTGGTTINNASMTLESATALGAGAVSTSGTSSITAADGVEAVLPGAIANKDGELTLNGTFDASALKPEVIGETYLGTDLTPGDNGFFRHEGSSIQLVENDNATVSENSNAVIKHDNGITYTLEGTDGMAVAHGETLWHTYYINTSDHEAKVSEIIEASKDAQGDALLQKIQMYAGTLGVNQSVYLMAEATNENGEIVARPVINVSGDDTELSGMINCATMHASGGKISATLHGDTSLTVTGNVEISGDSSQTGDTIITGPDATLTIGTDTALGASTVKLQNHATLDLNGKAANNMIEVTGCTVANADAYVGRMEVASDMTFVGPASAGCISLRDKGAITAESLRTTTLEALSDKGADRYSEHTIIGDVTINDSGAIILYSGKQITLTRGSLTLGNGVAMVLLDAGGEFAVGDILVTCISGTITGDFSELDFLINNEEQEGYRVEITEDRKSVVLAEEDKPIVGPDVPVQPDPAPVFDQATADVLAQGNWGVFTASRAFVNAVQGQRTNMGCIANGRGTAWAALLGATHDIDGSGAAAGSDTTLFGAAVGVDMQVGKRSSLGVAFGYTDAEVKPGGLSDVDQESGYIALYGEHGLKKFANNSCLALDWVLSTGTTESSYLGADWEQDHIQANARLTWTKKVSERFAYNVFGGLEYFASESDRVAGCKSGSIQNLRGELGVGARYVVKQGQTTACDGKGGLTPAAPGCDRVVVYGELSYINDMVRNNPSIEVNGLRGGGANPGRQGVGIEAGATFRIGERWSANANYSFNAMDDSNEHVLNIGASRTF